ncbi:hypothetical protein F2Q69_00048734 [Brassica cretica]|uniref:Uncharacterized protein n=1 Tax=Brassica cretica TaxID=69181 RepID=A0A8S9Q136_BRACR|nr:hypothetical protein F2Q69_00048734 [Brassica cretica]
MTIPELVFPDQLDILRPTVEPDLAWAVKKPKTDMLSHPMDHPDSPASVLIFTSCIHLPTQDVVSWLANALNSFLRDVGAATSWLCLPPCGVLGDIFSWVVWNLWITRNQLVFEARPASVETTALKALMGAREWTQAQEPPSKATKNTQIQGRPESIPTGTVACNTDAAWRKESSNAGLAWIFDSSTALIASDGCKCCFSSHFIVVI